jgi:hypothetical protein
MDQIGHERLLDSKPYLREVVEMIAQVGPIDDLTLHELLDVDEWRTPAGQPYRDTALKVRLLRLEAAKLGLIRQAGRARPGRQFTEAQAAVIDEVLAEKFNRHLDALVEDGLVRREMRDGKCFYVAVKAEER